MPIFKTHRHLDDGKLGLYALGDLPVCQAKTVENHLSSCANCRSELLQMRKLVTALRLLAPVPVAPAVP